MPKPETLTHQAVRDLAWLLTMPPLCHCTAESWQIPNPDWDTLVQLDASPEALENWLADKPVKRLGHYHEQLWLFYFHQHPQLELLASNRIIQGENRTLGEFDVLLKDHRDGLIWHLELAIKFYLGHHQGWAAADHWSHWLGVACQDSMEHKWLRLTEHQLRLSQQPEVRQQLQAQGLLPDRASALTRGMLFYPPTEQGRKLPAPKAMHPQHLHGHWLSLNDWLSRYQHDTNAQWRICYKPHWLATPDQAQWFSAGPVSRILLQQLGEASAQPETTGKKHQRKPQTGSEGVLLEKRSGERLYVVSNGWPGYLPLPWHRLR